MAHDGASEIPASIDDIPELSVVRNLPTLVIRACEGLAKFFNPAPYVLGKLYEPSKVFVTTFPQEGTIIYIINAWLKNHMLR